MFIIGVVILIFIVVIFFRSKDKSEKIDYDKYDKEFEQTIRDAVKDNYDNEEDLERYIEMTMRIRREVREDKQKKGFL
ncbi:hypothetical protein [uncultured Butyricimonas sp.]|uniref:hypothetical protein n=1 Tax=uncultured Butyricimonas sp. TaxID=1268785 RepID=UPI0026DC2D89|nr:hypothetical protein [uncultured Butyricimonas sp.]